MEELFNLLSSSARFSKPNCNKKRQRDQFSIAKLPEQEDARSQSSVEEAEDEGDKHVTSSRDRTGKRDISEEKRAQIHKEETAAFRRSMAIRVANKHDPSLPDPISSFSELTCPGWWIDRESFHGISRVIQRNIEMGRWKEPTPIQMQSIPTLLNRRDLIGAAPTGSGKSGAFIIPALFLSSAPYSVYYNSQPANNGSGKKQKGKKQRKEDSEAKSSHEGEIRALLLAPSRELAAQLNREVERLGLGKPGGISSMLLSKSNASHAISGLVGGKSGLDVLVSTPLRLVDAIEKGLRLNSTRLVVLDEADRLLDANDGNFRRKSQGTADSSDEDEEHEEDTVEPSERHSKNGPTKEQKAFGPSSGSSQTKTFLAQMDVILNALPTSTVRALFSATVTPTVRSLAESILRNPVDLKIAAPGSFGGANTDIEQKLTFVGREEGKLLAIRQLVQRGQLKPPAIVFVQSQERAQALFAELLYDGIHVDVLHAGRSKTARDNAVARFRRGDTWVLICTDLVARGVDFRAVNMVINYDLPTSGITYVHRIGRTGRAGRKGQAITLFTEADFENLRTIANVMKQSGCHVEEWMLQLQRKLKPSVPRRPPIDTTPLYDKRKRKRKELMIQNSKKKSKSQDGLKNYH